MRITTKTLLGIALFVGLLWAVYRSYPVLLFKVTEWQKQFNQQLSGSLTALGRNSQRAGWVLLAISFLYGVFHAVGPGHGKFILTGYLSLERTKLTQAIKISLLSSLAQGVVAVVLVSVIVVVFTLSRSYFNVTLKWVERGSFAIMILFGLYWCRQAFHALRKPASPQPERMPKIKRITKAEWQNSDRIRPLVMPLTPSPAHEHSAHCGCGHQHLPSTTQMQRATDWKAQLMIIFSIGARPCSGAILVLFLSYTLELYLWGVASALAMAVGTGLTLSLFACLVLLARSKAVSLSRWYLSERTSEKWGFMLKFLIGALLILLGITLFHSSFIETGGGTGLFKR